MHLGIHLTCAATMAASQATDRPVGANDSVVVAVRAQPPRVDGRLDDPAWALAKPVSRFVQRDPVEGAPAMFATEARVVYTEDAIYVGVRADDPEPSRIVAPLARRDERPAGDWIGIMIDPNHDRRTALEFAVNAAGVRYDAHRYNDFEVEPSWDGVWDARVSRDDRGWTAELWVPLSQLRFAKRTGIRFGFNVYREVGRTHEVQYWRLLSKHDRAVVSRFGEMAGLDALTTPSPVELSPYVSGRLDVGETRSTATLGVDARVALVPGTTLVAAINPDFGQVEADPAVVNLTSLETYLAERRAFFLEGSDLFRLPITADPSSAEGLLYTRRIGRPPQLTADAAVDATSILGAGKLVGRTASGWSLGSLLAATARETMGVDTGAAGRVTIEPRTLYGALRVARDLRRGRGQLAGFATLVAREPVERNDVLRSGAHAAGAMITHRFSRGYLFRNLVAFTRVTGSREAIALTQLSSVHYFQRPDIRFARFDPERTSLTGAAAWAGLARDSGATTWDLRWASLSPGLEINDIGFLSQAGKHSANATVGHRWQQGRLAHHTSVSVDGFWEADWIGRVSGRGIGVRTSATLLKYTTLGVQAWRNDGGAEIEALQGGPALARKGNAFYQVDVDTDPARRFRAGISLAHRPFDEALGYEQRVRATVVWRPSERWQTELTPSVEVVRYGQQYVGTTRANTPARYVVGTLSQQTLQLGVRTNFSFTPSLSVQGYAQPFSSSARYSHFSEVVAPAARGRADRLQSIPESRVHRAGGLLAIELDEQDGALTRPEPDFIATSLRSTVVIRWEFRRGSSATFVLQQNGASTEPVAGDALRAFSRVAALDRRTVAMLKLSYWLSM